MSASEYVVVTRVLSDGTILSSVLSLCLYLQTVE